MSPISSCLNLILGVSYSRFLPCLDICGRIRFYEFESGFRFRFRFFIFSESVHSVRESESGFANLANPDLTWIHWRNRKWHQCHKRKRITVTSLPTTPTSPGHSMCQLIQIQIHHESVFGKSNTALVSLFTSLYSLYIFGSRPSDHYFRSVCQSLCLFVCLFVCAEFFSAVFDPISIKLGHMLYVWL